VLLTAGCASTITTPGPPSFAGPHPSAIAALGPGPRGWPNLRRPFRVGSLAKARRPVKPRACPTGDKFVRTERHKSQQAPRRSLVPRYDRTTAIPHARSRAVLGIAPQTAERVGSHTLAAAAPVRYIGCLSGLESTRCTDYGALLALCKAHSSRASRLRLPASERNPTASAGCSPWS
jgi:hypothetical protein